MIAEVRAAFLLQRGRYGVATVSHRDALRWATEGGAACLGRPEGWPPTRYEAKALRSGRAPLYWRFARRPQ